MDDRDKRTLYIGNLPDRATEELLYELFLQAGPLDTVKIPKDNKSGRPRNYAFITFKHEVSVPYTVALMQGITLFGRELKLEPRSAIHQVNPYLEALSEHRRLSNGPKNTSTPTDYHRRGPALDRRHPYGSNNNNFLSTRGCNDFIDPNRRYQGMPLQSRTFTEGMLPPQPQSWHDGHLNGYNPLDSLRLGISPVGFAGDMKMRPFNDRFSMSPHAGSIPYRDRKYH